MKNLLLCLATALSIAGCSCGRVDVVTKVSSGGVDVSNTFYEQFDTAAGFVVGARGFGPSIPAEYVGPQGVPPILEWSAAPDGAKSFTVIVEDPDAPTDTPFIHWMVADIPAGSTTVNGGVEGQNDAGKPAYFGPAPPKGEIHEYHFEVFALDKTLGLKRGFRKAELEQAMKGHVIGRAEIVAKYPS